MFNNRLKAAALGLVTFGALGLAGAIATSPARADEQGIGLQIVRVDYNVKGTDTASNAYLESVRVQNKSDVEVSLAGHTLEDLTGHVYRFPSTFKLAPGAYVDVRTGRTPSSNPASWWNTGPNLYWNRTSHQYGNASDSATLENAAGARLDRVSWSDFSIRP